MRWKDWANSAFLDLVAGVLLVLTHAGWSAQAPPVPPPKEEPQLSVTQFFSPLPPDTTDSPESQAQFSIPTPPFFISSEQMSAKVEAVGPDGWRYVAFCAPGLIKSWDIYLAIDSNNDGAYEELWPTGLADCYIDVRKPMQLVVDSAGITISHNASRPWPHAMPPPVKQTDTYKADYLSFTKLRNDADADGLSDITEQMLLIDPRNADTDQDGQADGLDCTPSANPQRMGIVEVGIVRALKALQNSDSELAKTFEYWLKPQPSEYPWQARYFSVEGAMPVCFPLPCSTFSIFTGPDPDSRIPDLLHNCLYLVWTGNPLSLEETYAVMEDPAAEEPSAEELATWATEHRDQLGDGVYELSIELPSRGYKVIMVFRSGQLYPVSAYFDWII